MSDHDKDVDAHSGTETTGHEWDGIKELNTPLPRWWLITWYVTIAWAVVYMILMPAIPALPGLGTNTPGVRGHSDRVNVAASMDTLRTARQVDAVKLVDASLQEIETDRDLQQFAMAMGESAFGDNCATCHGAGGRGAKGYPVLADDVWLWDGTLDGIEYTLRHGIRHSEDPETRFSEMPAYGQMAMLDRHQINDVVEYVISLSHEEFDAEAAARGAETFEIQCTSCHGVDAKGMRDLGAPNLTDADWLYGGEREDIYATVFNARNSHMPAWDDRLDDATIKALAVYVHSLGGGE
ncbi:MAG: cytochrome-c oxidase, cbb3-type subunit III [Hyphomonadaceae bacterium]|nr:cytochrome-c oxidase, cbb3-type subunit III [Hyphomonadaceae bacterium]